jgi:hypothetical protein
MKVKMPTHVNIEYTKMFSGIGWACSFFYKNQEKKTFIPLSRIKHGSDERTILQILFKGTPFEHNAR